MGEKLVTGALWYRPKPTWGSRAGLTGYRMSAVAGAAMRRKPRKTAAKKVTRARVGTRKTSAKRGGVRKTKAEIVDTRMKNLRKAQTALKAKRKAAKAAG